MGISPFLPAPPQKVSRTRPTTGNRSVSFLAVRPLPFALARRESQLASGMTICSCIGFLGRWIDAV
ncbi:MAG: hypothetical protein COZ05_20620 [Armatimonadetes bacterium CG_4_10_14_3_um_filter_59_10]|nr:MAG: hypothetical protein COZ05_20620 [Armatimonadetes bacterium CG_4_10_14_3_um_filter_59_10]PJB71271.1 MAG: hypothetical protein CO095_08235 [Armatimonadetes bacterium CG_4_9_14_3_um_filter_58_7]